MLLRVAFDGSKSGIARLAVLCQGCLNEILAEAEEDTTTRSIVKPFGNGKGKCELCEFAVHAEAGLTTK